MSNRTDIVVETDNAEGQVLLSASRVYDLTEDKTQDTINGEIKNTLNQLDQNMAYVESGNTASRTYTYGQFISWKGVLYTVSDANGIPMGNSFAIGTNLVAVTDGNALCGGLNALLAAMPSFGSWSSLTALTADGFTAPSDGFVNFVARFSGAATDGYVGVNVGTLGVNIAKTNQNGWDVCMVVPIKKGDTAQQSGSSDLSALRYQYMTIV